MKVLEIRNIVRKDVPIYYRMFFSGCACLQLAANNSIERQIDFSIEIKPTGLKEILVALAEPVDYPLVPLIKALKMAIEELDKNGQLPF
ncbi:MAG: hypothetical protein LBC46_01920 [Treponema sp.]|jgi:hypothetical protein|nr:hypothetical protein [Treponema sp.]